MLYRTRICVLGGVKLVLGHGAGMLRWRGIWENGEGSGRYCCCCCCCSYKTKCRGVILMEMNTISEDRWGVMMTGGVGMCC